MVAVTWRLHRVELVVLAVTALVIALGTALYAGFARDTRIALGVDTCVPLPNTNLNCSDLSREWSRRVGPVFAGLIAFWAFPALVGSFLGGPLFGRELERGTHRLAWTQGVSRMRWAMTTFGLILAAVTAAAILLALVGGDTRWLMGLSGYRPWDTFDQVGPAFVSFVVFAFVASAFFGAWRRQILAGMFFGLLAFGVVRGLTIAQLRPYFYEAPVAVPMAAPPSNVLQPGIPWVSTTSSVPSDAWSLPADAVDEQGRTVPMERVNQLIDEYTRAGCRPGQTCDSITYLREHGVTQRLVYQPADRFWRFQVTEAAIYLALSAAFAAGTLMLLQRRDA